MHTNNKHIARLALAGGIALSVGLTGCKSGKSPMNLFSFKKSEPSPEVLAGNGPTVTYPAPPSANATPNAIASIPGGTAGTTANAGPITKPASTQLAGSKPGYVTSAGPNMSAAQANGYRTPSGSTGLNAQTASTRIASGSSNPGYQFGTKPTPGVTMPKTSMPRTSMPSTSTPSTKSSYTIPSLPSLPSKTTSTPAPSNSSSTGGGFTLPSNLAGAVQATSQTISKSADSAKEAASGAVEQAKSMDIPSIGISEPSTPSIQLNPKAAVSFPTPPSTPSTFATPPSTPSTFATPPSGGIYTPGSTAGASGYPSK